MRKHLVIAIILFTTFATEADENSSVQANTKEQYDKCVGVSLHTMPGRELNSIVENNRTIKDTTLIPEGWTVIGVTTKKETEVTTPYLVICH